MKLPEINTNLLRGPRFIPAETHRAGHSGAAARPWKPSVC